MLNNIETIICLLLLFMDVPDLCRKLGRPALGTAGLIMGFQEMIHRRWLKTGGDRNTFLLFNLPVSAAPRGEQPGSRCQRVTTPACISGQPTNSKCRM